MMKNVIFIITIGLFTNLVECSFLSEWLGWGDKKGYNLTYKGIPLLKIPFEELSPEDKFLVEASKIAGLELSELDVCQQKLIMKLKSSCGSLSEEQLAKLSVNLLNCQSAIEGRPQFPCDENMSLKSCTENMDGETWNTYHIMNNRARAVCYTTRQIHFRATTEMTINQLLSTTQSHLEQLNNLKMENEGVKSLTKLTLNEIDKSQEKVLANQKKMAAISILIVDHLINSINLTQSNLNNIQSHKLSFDSIFNNFTKQLGLNINKMKKSSQESNDLLNSVKQEMDQMSLYINKIIKNIEDGQLRLKNVENLAFDKLSETLLMVNQINAPIQQIANLFSSIQNQTYGITGNKDGEGIELMFALLNDVVLLIGGMILFSFLSAPNLLRFLMALSAANNIYIQLARLNNNHKLSTTTILFYIKGINIEAFIIPLDLFYFTLLLILFGDWLLRRMVKWSKYLNCFGNGIDGCGDNKLMLNTGGSAAPNNGGDDDDHRGGAHHQPPTPHHQSSANLIDNWISESQRLTQLNGFVNKSMGGGGHLNDNNIFNTPMIDDDRRSLAGSSVRRSSRRTATTPARSRGDGELDNRLFCLAISKSSGNRCKNLATSSSIYCKVHSR